MNERNEDWFCNACKTIKKNATTTNKKTEEGDGKLMKELELLRAENRELKEKVSELEGMWMTEGQGSG